MNLGVKILNKISAIRIQYIDIYLYIDIDTCIIPGGVFPYVRVV